ncbi:hypothetical protein E0H62_15265 [Rhizobium leguminosarum bv. viciae]|nr:hypothetical protein E0H62_15265 [Rhizobium leguminosarum bv. viciae]
MKMYLLARRLGVVAISFALASCTTTPAAAGVDRRRFKWLIVESRQTHAWALFMPSVAPKPHPSSP